MENSTKALLIAASILIVLVLISIGLNILGSTKDTSNQIDSVSGNMAASYFNSQYLSYFSSSTTAAQARALVTKIIANNAAVSSGNTYSVKAHQIKVNYYALDFYNGTQASPLHAWSTRRLQEVYNKISDSHEYSISATQKCTEYPGGYYNGYIVCISIKELKN